MSTGITEQPIGDDEKRDAVAGFATAAEVLAVQRRAYLREGPPTIAVRRHRIDRLLAMVLDNLDAYVDAMVRDFGTRSRTGILFAEVMGMLSTIEHTRSHIGRWMRPSTPKPMARLYGIRAQVQPTPLGVVGIIGPWNFPLQLVVVPAAAAFAAGNRVMIKMSEVTAHTAELTRALARGYFDQAELAVVTGGPEVAAGFAELPFDHLFFTGSTRVGRLVQRAAATHLVPVTLELGGKNPVVVAPEADISQAAARIARARMVNGGQVCVSPDYVFVPEARIDALADALRAAFRDMFATITADPDYTACVDAANYERVLGLIDDARARGARVDAIAPPGEALPERVSRKIAPTIVCDVTDEMPIATEEIFGPVLVLRTYSSIADVVDHLNERPAPLVAYWYGPDGPDFRTFVRHTRSGGVSRNDFALTMFPENAPFGGVGQSGMGAYRGKAGFDTFTHYRTVAGADLPFVVTALAAPPFTRPLRCVIDVVLRFARRRTRRRVGGSVPARAPGDSEPNLRLFS
ncbi:aldehyde dehydrogenase family protein [Nocardia wallacei]|uniref:aldehyde dehydrogenase family protein n=1 Tax=Nocardia wallacei TaxID=480035 RepID=UPI002457B586|nr:aldehyde dehydrogenase family protein [Nocardia wallacei]